MRSGALSDEAVMEACSQFFPIPMKSISMLGFKQELNSGLEFRPSKYHQSPSVPKNYHALSNSMAKHLDPTNVSALVSSLSDKYKGELADSAPPPPAPPPPPSGGGGGGGGPSGGDDDGDDDDDNNGDDNDNEQQAPDTVEQQPPSTPIRPPKAKMARNLKEHHELLEQQKMDAPEIHSEESDSDYFDVEENVESNAREAMEVAQLLEQALNYEKNMSSDVEEEDIEEEEIEYFRLVSSSSS